MGWEKGGDSEQTGRNVRRSLGHNLVAQNVSSFGNSSERRGWIDKIDQLAFLYKFQVNHHKGGMLNK